MHACKIFITFEVSDNQRNRYVPMCKGNINKSNEQVQTGFLDLFDVEKKVEMSFSASELSSLGGLPLLAKSAKRSDFLNQFSRQIRDWRNPAFVVHAMSDLVKQRVFQITAGYEDADDCDLLRHDSMLKLAVGHRPNDRDLCSQPTMTRLENHISHQELWDIGNLFVSHFISSYKKEPVRIILDIDDSNSNAYGGQQLTLFNNYYGEYCYMPLFIFEAQSQRHHPDLQADAHPYACEDYGDEDQNKIGVSKGQSDEVQVPKGHGVYVISITMGGNKNMQRKLQHISCCNMQIHTSERCSYGTNSTFSCHKKAEGLKTFDQRDTFI